MDKFTIIHLFLGPLLVVLSYLYYQFPPKKINSVYGYRTKRSMRNQEAWDCANAYSAKAMSIVAGSTCLVQLVTYSLISNEDSVFWSAMYMAAALVFTIPLTEIYLKRQGY